MWGFFPHHQAILRHHLVSYNSTQFWHCPPGDSSRLEMLTSPHFLRPPPEFARAAHRTQRNIILSRLPVYYKRIQLRNSQMEEMHRAGYRERTWSFQALSDFATHPKCPCVHQSGRCLKPVFLGFHGGFIVKAWLIKSPAIGDWTQSPGPLPSLEVRGGTESSSPLTTWLAPLTTRPHLLMGSKRYLINITKDTFYHFHHRKF